MWLNAHYVHSRVNIFNNYSSMLGHHCIECITLNNVNWWLRWMLWRNYDITIDDRLENINFSINLSRAYVNFRHIKANNWFSCGFINENNGCTVLLMCQNMENDSLLMAILYQFVIIWQEVEFHHIRGDHLGFSAILGFVECEAPRLQICCSL